MIEPLLKSALEPVARRQRHWRVGKALALAWAGWAVFGLLVSLLQSSLALPVAVVVVGFVVGGLGVTVAAWWRARQWRPDYREIARRIEQQHPELHALLVTAIEQQPDAETGQFNFLQQRVIDEAISESRKHPWLDAVSTRSIVGIEAAQVGALAACFIALIALDQVGVRTTRVARHGHGGPTEVSVTPGDASVERGMPLVVMAKFSGAVPSEAMLVISGSSRRQEAQPSREKDQSLLTSAATMEGNDRRYPLSRNLADPVFGGSIPEVGSNLTYHIEYGKERTRDFKLTVFDYPALQKADARVKFPDYTQQPEKSIEDTRRISAVEGSTLDYTLALNKPVARAQLRSKDGTVLPLRVETNLPVAKLEGFTLAQSGTYDLQLVDAEGRTNKVASQFVFKALTNRAPELKLVTPKGDQRVSALQEISYQGEVWDDFGLRDYGITYTVAGQDPKSFKLGTQTTANAKTNFQFMLKLEDLGVAPDALVSWFIWAEDVGPDGQVRRTSGDMYFAEVRPFDEIFREGQAGETPPGEQEQQEGPQGGESAKLAELQKQVINATWKLQRASSGTNAVSAQYKKDAPVVLEGQESAREQAEALLEKAQDPRVKSFVEAVIQEMDKAIEQLTKAADSAVPLPEALKAEQAAYQGLLRLAAREFNVTQSRKQQGKGQQSGQPNQQQLSQLDFKQQDDRYETQKQASSQNQATEQREQLQVQNRLKELAQRQQDLNERVKELQTALQEAKTEEEKEEIRRRLKRLREDQQEMLADMDELRDRMEKPENQSQMAEARQQMEKARQEAQQATEALEKNSPSQALASGTRAQQELQQLRDEFRKKNASQFTEEMRQMRNDARELSQKQEEIGQQLDQVANSKRKTLTDNGEAKELAEKLEQQRAGFTNLLDNMRQTTEKAEAVEPLLARQLYDTLRQNSQNNTDTNLFLSSAMVKASFLKEAGPFEEKARGEINQLKEGVEKAAESVLGDDTESLRQARRELENLSRELDREMQRAAAGERGTNGNAQSMADARGEGQQQGGSTNQTQRAGQGREGQGENAQAQAGEQQKRDGQPGERGQDGEQASAQPGQQGRKPGEGGQGEGQQPQPGQQGQRGEQPGQQGQGQQGQRGEQAGQQPGQQGQRGEQPGQGQQGQGQQGERGQQQAGTQPGQQGQQPGQQPGQQGQQGQGGQQRGQGQGRGQQPGQQASTEPGQNQEGEPQDSQQQAQAGREGGRGGRNTTQARNAERNLFEENTDDRSPGDGGGGRGNHGPLTGEDFANWSDRLRDVEEMLDQPELRGEAARVRDRARAMRAEFKRHSLAPKWDLVKSQIATPLAQLRDRVADELARREKTDSLVPIDRDPVPAKFTDLVRRYYEKLGQGDTTKAQP
jgi:hypothetical protein